jgi:hypothetical protein
MHKRLIPPSNNNKPVKKVAITDCPSSSTLASSSPRNATASIRAIQLDDYYVQQGPTLTSEVQSFVVEIYKEIGIDGSKSILAAASSMPVMQQKEQHDRQQK